MTLSASQKVTAKVTGGAALILVAIFGISVSGRPQIPVPSRPMPSPKLAAYSRLTGNGLEIGALHEPAPLPAASSVTYFDAQSKAASVAMYPEIPAAKIVEPNVIGNLDTDKLSAFPDQAFDFVVISHVLEHLANPVGIMLEVFRVLKPGGQAVIAVPDQRYTFDRLRPTVSWTHLLDDYRNDRTRVDDDHYLEFLRYVHAADFLSLSKNMARHIARARERHEHAHAWDSHAFRGYLLNTLDLGHIRATPLLEAYGEETELEYVGLWRKD